MDPHVCQFPNDYYYNQNPLENKIILKDQDMKQIKNTQRKQLNQEISTIKEVAQKDSLHQMPLRPCLSNPFGRPQKKVKQIDHTSNIFDL